MSATFATKSLPSFARGPDNFQAMLLGLHRMDEHFHTTPVEKTSESG
jgi:glucose-6-phosphate isomerase